jgi:signal transduction histidine kinase
MARFFLYCSSSCHRRLAFDVARSQALALLLLVSSVSVLLAQSTRFQQSRTADSLQQALTRFAENDTTRVRLLNALTRTYWTINTDTALRYARQAIVLAQQLGDKKGEANGYNNLAVAHWYRGEYEQALANNRRSLALREFLNDEVGILASYNNIGGAYYSQGDFPRALEYFLKSLALAERIHNEVETISARINIGEVYKVQGDYKQALASLQQATEIATRNNRKPDLVHAYNNMGEIFAAQHDYDQALEYFNSSLLLASDLRMDEMAATNHRNIGNVYRQQGKLQEAIESYRAAVALHNVIGDKPGLATTYTGLGMLFLQRSERDSASRYLNESLRLAVEIGARDLEFQALMALLRLDSLRGDISSAFVRFRRALSLHDSLFGAQRARQIAEIQARYDNEKREQEIALLQKEQSFQTTIRNILLGGLLVVCMVAAFLFNGYFYVRRKNKELANANAEILRQKAIVEEQAANIEAKNGELYQANLEYEFAIEQVNNLNNFLREQNSDLEELNAETMRQQEIMERQTIEIELTNNALQEKNAQLEHLNAEKNEFLGIAAHDLKNPLASIIMSASTIRRYHERMSAPELLNTALNIEETAKTMNQIIMNLLDTNAIESGKLKIQLEEFDIGDVIQDVSGRYVSRANEKHITLLCEAAMGTCVYADQAMTMQALDNLVSNAIKYSPPGKVVRVTLLSDPSVIHSHLRSAGQSSCEDCVLIMVQDEGPGLSEEDKRKLFGKFARLSARPTGGEHSTGLGLSIVKKLAEAMHGKVWCESELGYGATFVLQLPTTPPHKTML